MSTTAQKIVANMASAMQENPEAREAIGEHLGNSFPDAIESAAASIDTEDGEKTVSRSDFEDMSASRKKEVATDPDTHVVAE